MASQPVRGLIKFIQKLKESSNDHDRDYCVRAELGKIHSQLQQSGICGYDKRKCLLKLLYIRSLGYEVDMGHVEAVELMSSRGFQEKMAGYMGCEVLLPEKEELHRLVVNTVKEDLRSSNGYIKGQALNFIANSSSGEVNKNVYSHLVTMLTVTPEESPMLRKKLYICILQMLRTSPELFNPRDLQPVMEKVLLNEKEHSCLIALINLLIGCVKQVQEPWDGCAALIVDKILFFLSKSMQGPAYHVVKHPFLVVKMLGFLEALEPHPKAQFLEHLKHALERIINRMHTIDHPKIRCYSAIPEEDQDRVRIWTMSMSVTLATVRVIAVWLPHMPRFPVLYISKLLDKLFQSSSPSVYMVGIEIAYAMLKSPMLIDTLKAKVPHILPLLSSTDPSVRSMAGSLLAKLCDEFNWELIIPELIALFRASDTPTQEALLPPLLKAVKKCLPKGKLYVDTVFNILTFSLEARNVDQLGRILLTTSPEQQAVIATKCLSVLKTNNLNDALLRVCASMIGAYGHAVSHRTSMKKQAFILGRMFIIASPTAKCEILNALAKLAARDSALRSRVESFLEYHATHSDISVQMTACELLNMIRLDRPIFQSLMIFEDQDPVPIESDAETAESFISSEEERRDSDSDSDSEWDADSEPQLESPSETDSNSELESDSDVSQSSYLSSDSDDSEAPIEQPELLQGRLMSNRSGELYSDESVSIWIEQAYCNSDAKVLLRITDTTPRGSLVYINSTHIQCQMNLEARCHNDIRGALQPNGCKGHKLSFVLRGPVSGLPRYIIEYTVETEERSKHRRVALQLPVAHLKFWLPLSVDQGSVGNLWDSLDDEECSDAIPWQEMLHPGTEAVAKAINGYIAEVSY